MGTLFGKAALGAAVAACMGLTAAPAEARDDYYWGDRGDNDAALAIGAGLVGLAIGAAIASDRDDRYYYPNGYYYPRYRGSYYYNDYPVYRGYPRYRYNNQYRYRDRDRYRYRDRYRDRRYWRY